MWTAAITRQSNLIEIKAVQSSAFPVLFYSISLVYHFDAVKVETGLQAHSTSLLASFKYSRTLKEWVGPGNKCMSLLEEWKH